MNVVDTSAILAVLFDEPERATLEPRLVNETCVMSAATRVELGIVVEARTGSAGTQLLDELLTRLDMGIVAVDERQVQEALVGWRRFGKGRHPAGLNYGDTFSYALSRTRGEPLLFVGEDFPQTDVPV